VICPACGTPNAGGRRFCLECGGPLAAACPNCGALNEAGALPWCDRAIALCEDAELDLLCGHAMVTRASVLLGLGRQREGWALLRGARDQMEEEGLNWVALRASVNLASYSVEDDPRSALETVRAGTELATRLGLLGFTTYLMGNALGAGEVLGDWDWVEATSRQFAEIQRNADAREWFTFVVASIGTYRGEDHGAVLEAMWRTGEAAADPQTMANAASALARRAYLKGDFEDGLAWIDRGRDAAGSAWNLGELGFEARLALLIGARERMAVVLEGVRARRGRRAILADTAMVEAAAAALDGRRLESIAGYRVALDRYRELGLRFLLVLTVLEVAAVLGPDVAIELGATDEARAILVELRCAPLVARLDALLATAAGVEAQRER
jgi:hypothetical protein